MVSSFLEIAGLSRTTNLEIKVLSSGMLATIGAPKKFPHSN